MKLAAIFAGVESYDGYYLYVSAVNIQWDARNAARKAGAFCKDLIS
jgi:hypothetical protein